jgi:hypothetical protein
MLANKTIKNDAGNALKEWSKYSKILIAVGACYLFGVLALGVVSNASAMVVALYMVPLASAAFFYLGIGNELKNNPDIKNASSVVRWHFYICLMVLFGMFFGYLKIVVTTDLKNVGAITKQAGSYSSKVLTNNGEKNVRK